MLVPAVSAVCGRDWGKGPEFIILSSADHSDMMKFSESYHDRYEKARDILDGFIQLASSVIVARLLKAPEISDT